MTQQVEIPVAGLSLQLPAAAFPPGPPGPPGGLAQRVRATAGVLSTGAQSWQFMPLAASITTAGGVVDIIACGLVGHNTPGAVISLTVCRGADMLHDPSMSGLVVARVPDVKDMIQWHIAIRDTAPFGTHEYKLAWRQSSGNGDATAYLGRRGLDAQFTVPASLIIDEVTT